MSDPDERPVDVLVRPTRTADLEAVHEISRLVYTSDPWNEAHLASHLSVFPEGQFVAVDAG